MVEATNSAGEEEIAEEIETPDLFDENESDDPIFAVEDALDSYGQMRKQEDGLLGYEDFLVLKEVIIRQALRMFAPEKVQLTERKVAALKAKNEKEYMKLAHFMRLAYQKCLLIITKKACDEIYSTPAVFQQSMAKYLEDYEKREELEAMEKRVRLALAGKKVTQSLDQVLAAAKFKYRKDKDVTASLDALALISPQDALDEAESHMMQKLSDAMLAEHGIDIFQLENALKHFKIEQNPDYIAFQEEVESENLAKEKLMEPNPDMICKVIDNAKALGDPQYNDEDEDGALTFDYFVQVNQVIVNHALTQVSEQLKDLRERRREAIESYEDDLFEELVLQTVMLEQKSIQVFQGIVYQVVDLRSRDFIKAKVKYLMNPEQNSKYEAELQQLKDKLEVCQNTANEVSREQVCEGWRALEKGNILRDQKVLDFSRENPDVPRQMVTAMKQVEWVKQKDNFFNEQSYEISDLEAAINKFELKDSDEIKAISAEEYQSHADKFQAKTETLMGKIALIQTALKLEAAKQELVQAQQELEKAEKEEEEKISPSPKPDSDTQVAPASKSPEQQTEAAAQSEESVPKSEEKEESQTVEEEKPVIPAAADIEEEKKE